MLLTLGTSPSTDPTIDHPNANSNTTMSTTKQSTTIELANFHRNCLGTVSFDAKFEGMRKAQEFDVYPMGKGHTGGTDRAKVQSETRLGFIDLTTGEVMMSKAVSGGASQKHLATAASAGKLTGDQLLILKSHIFGSASAKAGTNGVMFCDNSGASEVFSQAAATGVKP